MLTLYREQKPTKNIRLSKISKLKYCIILNKKIKNFIGIVGKLVEKENA